MDSRSLEYAVLDRLLEGCQIIDSEWRYIYLNDAALVHAGKPLQELSGNTMMECYPGIEQTEMFAVLERVMATRNAEHVENEFSFPDGRTGWFDLHIQPWEADSILIFSIDISLRKNQANRLNAIIESMPDCVISVDQHGLIRDTNIKATTMFGYPKEELIGQSVEILIPERMQQKHKKDRSRFGVGSPSRDMHSGMNFAAKHKDGSEFPVDISLSLLDLGTDPLTITVIHDLRPEFKAQSRIQSQLRRLTALHHIDLAIAGSLDLSLMLDVILEQTTTQLDMDAADILLLDPNSHRLVFSRGRGLHEPSHQDVRIKLGEGLAGKVALQRNLLHLGETEEGATFFTRFDLMRKEGMVDYYGVPLIAKGKVIGVLEVFSQKPREVDEEWRAFFMTLAGQAAIAIDSASLFDELQATTTELALAYDETIEGWSRALDLRDHETMGHTQRVADLTEELARNMGKSEYEIVQIRRGALLHDMGKMGIPDSILLKPGPLTDEEWAIMRRHPQIAYDLLSEIDFLNPAVDIPFAHHEKWDGSGYPRGLSGDLIPEAARIFAIVDVWDALRSERPYRAKWDDAKALAFIREQTGTHFDPEVFRHFEIMINGVGGSGT